LKIRRKRAAWRAQHRGTKEMDWLLGKFADARLPVMSGDDLDTFERLLSLPDPDLNQWIIEPATLSDRSIAPLIGEIRAFHNLDVAS
jgi:antitoxin CptB